MIERREFLKGIGALPLLFGGKEVQKQKTCLADEIINPTVESEFPVIYQYWRNRWWRAQGNRIEWTELRHHPIHPATDGDFDNWLRLTDRFDYCQSLMPFQDKLLWIGRRKVWEIDYDYCFALKEFMPIIQYKCETEFLNIPMHYHDLGISP